MPGRSAPALPGLPCRRGLLGPLTAGLPALTLILLSGCQSELDMAKAFDERRAATTIPYAGVGEAERRFPDYSPIQAKILESPPAGSPAGGTPPSKPRRP